MLRKLILAGATLGAVLISGCVDDEPTAPPPPTEAVVVHYWHFNTLPEGTLADPIPSDVSLVAGATVSYPGTGAGYADRVDGTDLNAQPGVPPGFAFRARNPANTRELIISAPTTGHEEIIVSYAATRTSSGAQTEEFYYSTDGATWVKVGTEFSVQQDVFEQFSFDLSATAAVNNNAALRFRVLQTGTAAAGTSGNNRFDNITVIGKPIS